MADDDKTEDPPETKPKRNIVGLLLKILLPLGAYGAGVGSGVYAVQAGYLGGDEVARASEDTGEAVVTEVVAYKQIEGSFTCNLKESARLVQAEISVSSRTGDAAFDALDVHADPVRSAILAVMMDQSLEDVSTRAGKARMRSAIRDAINAELRQRAGTGDIAEVFITNLIIQ